MICDSSTYLLSSLFLCVYTVTSLKRGMATHASVLAWRVPSLVGYSPWGHKESDTTEAT